MAPDLEPRVAAEGSSPEAVLRFLSQHRQGVERRLEPKRGIGRRGRKAALLGIVAALALAGVSVLIWRNVAHSPTTSRQGDTAASGKNSTHSSSAPSRPTEARRTQKAAVHRLGDAPWNRGLEPFGRSTGRRVPNFYYGSLHTHVSCPGYATYGCWKVEVVTRHACPHGVMVVVAETRNGGSEGASWGFSRRLAARTRTLVEVDRDQPGVSGRINSVLCTPDRS